MSRATLGGAIGALFGAITGTCIAVEKAVNTASHVVDVVDNVALAGVKKSDNFRKASALADDAQYMLDIVALIQSNPEVGKMYMADPSMLPEGISLEVLEQMLAGSYKPVKQVSHEPTRVIEGTASQVNRRSRRRGSDGHYDSDDEI